ncbi:112_t:CDS:2, partial [Funneliformis caledonium]
MYKEFGLKDAIFSKVKDKDRAIKAGASDGPGFGDDIKCYGNSDKNFENILCQKRRNYEKEIRNTEDKFSMEDYE